VFWLTRRIYSGAVAGFCAAFAAASVNLPVEDHRVCRFPRDRRDPLRALHAGQGTGGYPSAFGPEFLAGKGDYRAYTIDLIVKKQGPAAAPRLQFLITRPHGRTHF
jgi:hypothetical protein